MPEGLGGVNGSRALSLCLIWLLSISRCVYIIACILASTRRTVLACYSQHASIVGERHGRPWPSFSIKVYIRLHTLYLFSAYVGTREIDILHPHDVEPPCSIPHKGHCFTTIMSSVDPFPFQSGTKTPCIKHAETCFYVQDCSVRWYRASRVLGHAF